MKTIIVPTDFSEASNNAMQYAAGLAKDTGSDIVLFHVYQVPVSMSDVPIILVSVEELQKAAETRMYEAKRELEQTAGTDLKIDTETKLGDTIDELQSACERLNPFAVVMGSTGTTAFERTFFGSTTLAAVKHLSCPVIVVPPEKKYSHIKEIGFACDFKEVVETTPTHTIKDFVNELHADLHVLNVRNDGADTKLEKAEQAVLLHNMLQDLHPVYDYIENSNVEEGINKFAEQNNLDLVITIPKKHKLLDGLFKKNHTKELVFHSHVPIMCVHE